MTGVTQIWQCLASIFVPIEPENPCGFIRMNLQNISIFIGGLWAVYLIRREIRNLERTNRASHYSELDRNYTDILLQAIERPYLRDPAAIAYFVQHGDRPLDRPDAVKVYTEKDADFTKLVQAYDTYAFISMNFVETIRDRCVESTASRLPFGLWKKPDLVLTKTWQPIIASEIRLHRAWFAKATNEKCIRKGELTFCAGFCDFVMGTKWSHPNAIGWEDRRATDIWSSSEWIACDCGNYSPAKVSWVQGQMYRLIDWIHDSKSPAQSRFESTSPPPPTASPPPP